MCAMPCRIVRTRVCLACVALLGLARAWHVHGARSRRCVGGGVGIGHVDGPRLLDRSPGRSCCRFTACAPAPTLPPPPPQERKRKRAEEDEEDSISQVTPGEKATPV